MNIPDKLYYTPSEVSKILGYGRETLRKSTALLALNCGRTDKFGWRRYSKQELGKLLELRAKRAEAKIMKEKRVEYRKAKTDLSFDEWIRTEKNDKER